MMEKLAPDLFWKIKIEHISGSIVQGFIQFVFLVCQVEDYWNFAVNFIFLIKPFFLHGQKFIMET